MTASSSRQPICQEISQALLATLFENMRQGGHLALVAPRQAGKVQVIYELCRRAEALHDCPPRFVILRRADFSGATEADWLAALRSKLIPPTDRPRAEFAPVANDGVLPGVDPSTESRQARLDFQVTQVLEAAIAMGGQSSPLWLVIQSIPELPGPLMRGLLTACQFFSQDSQFHSRFSVLVTGSRDLVALTYGDNSPYRQATKYFVVGFDKELTRRLFFARLNGVSLKRGLDDRRCDGPMDEDALTALHEWTGGNGGLIEELVMTLSRAGVADQEEVPQNIRWTRDRIDHLAHRFVTYHMTFHRYSALNLQEIEGDRGDWAQLQELFPSGNAEASHFPRGPSPCRLLTSGIVRDDGPGGRWRISCGLWREFLRANMGSTRRADVFALQGHWNRAWEIYSTVPSSVEDRPLDGEPRYYWRKVLHLWEETLSNDDQFDLDTATEPVGTETSLAHRLWRFFARGMCALYGIQSGHIEDLRQPSLKHDFGPCARDCETLIAKHDLWTNKPLTPVDGRSRILSIPEPNTDWTLPHHQPRLVLALPRGHQFDPRVVTDLRRSLKRFWTAWENVQRRELDRELGALRQRHLQVVHKINQEAMGALRHPDRLLKAACRTLIKEGGYFRILISLVSPDGARITGIASACAQPRLDFTDPTHYPLTAIPTGSKPDIQQWVVLHRHTATISDARLDIDTDRPFRGNTVQAQDLHMRGLAVIPLLLTRTDDPTATQILGTLHIERKDGQPPSPNEISSLEVVAAQLAMAFDQSRRRWMLERALEEIPSEFRLIARDGRVIYRNRAAMVADHSKSSGWNGPLTVAPGTRPPLPDGCSRAMRLTLEQNAAEHLHAFSRFHLDNLNKGDASPGSRQWAETVAPLEDFRSQLRSPLKADGWVGVVQQVTDLTAFVELSHLVRNTLVVTNLAETCERILNFFRQRGHRWARIYLCDESKDQQLTLRSKAEFGISDPVVAERFRNGGFTITQADHNDVVWFLFQGEPRPVIFEHDETAQSGPTLFSEYPGSLKSYRVRDLWRQEFQKTDARWLEVPLFHGHVKVGLLALDIPNRFTAFEHETLSWACNCISSALYSAQQALAYSRVAEGQGVLDGAKAAAAMATHQLANLFGPIESACLYIQQDLAQMPSGSPQRESLRFNARLIEKEVVRAMEILRDFGRYVSDKPLPDVHGTRLEPVLNSIVADLRHYWQDIGFDLHVPERPSGVEPLSVIVSRSGLQEVFGILAANADRHGRRQPTQSLKVDIHLEFTTKGVRIRFRDNGVGVTSADRSRIFTPFFTTHSQGTGLGLAIAVNLMRRMNGSLTIADNAEGGACFCLELTAATHTGLNPITGEEHA